ncbi:hypothetical protein [Longirhabdus pacifica]|uniref:hypothetical protein n=1 Tax=Longirhabdus pacifica TaxID=2305227 RepID=UPI001008E293|nr:hypothetical protein [Longirhabdus pacifica]
MMLYNRGKVWSFSFMISACLMISLVAGTTLFSENVLYAKEEAEVMVPDYELKVFLDPALVLNEDKKLNDAVQDYFNTEDTVEKLAVQFMDTEDLDIRQEGWSVRIRKKEAYSDEEFELTYKKRYPIENGDIDAALALSASENFTLDDDNYEAQVDWGYEKQTLSISRKKIIEENGYDGMELPTRKDSRDWTIEEAPGKFENWTTKNWGTDLLEQVDKPYGPVSAKKKTGSWNGHKIYIEVWEILNENGTGYDYIVEASFKMDDGTQAEAEKKKLEQEMADAGWFLPVDQLKTSLILERY